MNSYNLNLNSLKKGLPGLTSAQGESFAEACSVCLNDNHSSKPIPLKVIGDIKEEAYINPLTVTIQMKKCHNDLEVATENGAYALSFLIIQKFTDYTIIQRSRKGTGFDYWLGNSKKPLFQGARLEVSGIRNGSLSDIKKRVRIKKKQVNSVPSPLPSYVIVVEFSKPISEVVKNG